jgi:hypothetical protein
LRGGGEEGGVEGNPTEGCGYARDIPQTVSRAGVEQLDLARIDAAVVAVGLDQAACKNDGVHDLYLLAV